MSATNERLALVLNIQVTLSNTWRDKVQNPGALRVIDQLLAFSSAKVTIADRYIRVEGYDRGGERLMTYELEEPRAELRHGRLIDHKAGSIQALRMRTHKVAPASWLLSEEQPQQLRILLDNGTTLSAACPFDVRLSLSEARMFWGDLFWLQPRQNETKYWQSLARFGVPQRLSLEDATTGSTLVDMTITAAARTRPDVLAIEGYHFVEIAPLHGSLPSNSPAPSVMADTLGAGQGEHIGWIIAPAIIKEIQGLTNEIAGACSEFDQLDWKGNLVIDWYARAASALGTTKLNAFTRIRELLKAAIALYVLPTAINNAEIPPEMDPVYRTLLESFYADTSIPPEKRWCHFVNWLKQPPPEFGGQQPTETDHQNYRGIILRELVNKVIQNRYACPVVPPPGQLKYSCWAFDLDARNFKMKVRPGGFVINELAVTDQGLRLDLCLQHVSADFEYIAEPAGSAGNVALCIFSLGFANIVESQFGDGTVWAQFVRLVIDLVPKQVGTRIDFEVKLGEKSQLGVEYDLKGVNVFTLGLAQLIGAILSFADAFEGTLLDSIAEQIKNFIADLHLNLLDLFKFEDTPAPDLDTAVVVSNPGSAQFVGARLFLPPDRAPSPLPTLAMPTCSADFAITLAVDYLNGVLSYRLSEFQKTKPPIQFDWRAHLLGSDLPDVALPEGYKPSHFRCPEDHQETEEEWTIGPPALVPANFQGNPTGDESIGVIRIPLTYRLTRTLYGWAADVHLKRPVREWHWWMGPGPLRDRVSLDHAMTARYGMYRQTDGQIISSLPAHVEAAPVHVNPSEGWHLIDNGGIATLEWSRVAISTMEHINVRLEASLPAHLTLSESVSFLPTLVLAYGPLEVAIKKASFSSSFTGLDSQADLFRQLTFGYLQQFAEHHPFKKCFEHAYTILAWPICGKLYATFGPDEVSVWVSFALDTMVSAADKQKVQIEGDGRRFTVTFRFLEGLNS